MTDYRDLPAFGLDCESLKHEKLTEVLALQKYTGKVFAFKQGLDECGDLALIIILAPTQEVANDFAKGLGQQAEPTPITPLSGDNH